MCMWLLAVTTRILHIPGFVADVQVMSIQLTKQTRNDLQLLEKENRHKPRRHRPFI